MIVCSTLVEVSLGKQQREREKNNRSSVPRARIVDTSYKKCPMDKVTVGM